MMPEITIKSTYSVTGQATTHAVNPEDLVSVYHAPAACRRQSKARQTPKSERTGGPEKLGGTRRSTGSSPN